MKDLIVATLSIKMEFETNYTRFLEKLYNLFDDNQ